jgi:hypothetical protein
MKRHIKDDPDFANVSLPVDVFHFKPKVIHFVNKIATQCYFLSSLEKMERDAFLTLQLLSRLMYG